MYVLLKMVEKVTNINSPTLSQKQQHLTALLKAAARLTANALCYSRISDFTLTTLLATNL